VAHEDRGSKPAMANSSQEPILKNPSQKRAGAVAQGEVPEFKSQYCKKKKKQEQEQNQKKNVLP
jgi:hypothetical protein